MFNQIKGSFYSLFFILLNLIYLVIELSFNARILDVSAEMSPDMDFSQLEIYGRTISATGATILAWRLLVSYQATLNLFRLVIKFFIIAVIVFPLVFIGQKKLVDNLVDSSTSETRRSAEILSLLKYGISNGFLEIEELAMDELTLLTAEGKMFITISGLLVYNSSHLREILEQKLDKIAGYAINTQQNHDTQRLYKNYLYARDQVIVQFEQYQNMVEDLERKQSMAHEQAIELYEAAMNKAMLQWLQFQQLLGSNRGIANVSIRQVSDMQALLLNMQQRFNACSSHECERETLEQLEFRLSQVLGFYSPVDDWCQSGAPMAQDQRLLCEQDLEEIQRRIIQARRLTLALQAGLSEPYATKLDYLRSMDLRASVFADLKTQGIEAKPEWNFAQHDELLADITHQLQQQYLQLYEQAVLETFQSPLPPRTELKEFNLIDQMQVFYQQALGDEVSGPVEINLNQTQFEERYVAIVYFAKFNALLNKLKAGEEWYEADAPYEASGKSSLRNLVVPAVAIAFSLIFGLLNMMNLLLNFVFILIQEKLWLRWLGILLLTGIMILLPQRQEYEIYSQSAYQDLLAETRSNYHYWADVLDWVAKTEPLVYPLGHVLRYNLLDGFNFD